MDDENGLKMDQNCAKMNLELNKNGQNDPSLFQEPPSGQF